MFIAVTQPHLRTCVVENCSKFAAFDLNLCWDHAAAASDGNERSGEHHQASAAVFSGDDPISRIEEAADRVDVAHDANSIVEHLVAHATNTDEALRCLLDQIGTQREHAARLVATLQDLDGVPDEAIVAAEALSAQTKARHEAAQAAVSALNSETVETVLHYVRFLRFSALEQLETAERSYWQI